MYGLAVRPAHPSFSAAEAGNSAESVQPAPIPGVEARVPFQLLRSILGPRTAHRTFAGALSTTALGAALFLTGCASPHPPPQYPPEGAQPELAGRATYFGDAIGAEATVVAFRHARLGGATGTRDRDTSAPGGRRRGGGMGGPPPGEGGGSRSDEGRPRRGFGDMPRQTMKVTFTNRTDTPVSFAITELRSAIGNFVPQPGTMTLEPGASGTLEPVSGDAGGILNWLNVTIALRRDRQTESHTLRLVPTGEAEPMLNERPRRRED